MKFLTWMLGVMVILLALESRGSGAGGWTAVWWTAAVLWFFVGCGLALSGVAKLVSGKVGAGAFAGLAGKRPPAPAQHKEE